MVDAALTQPADQRGAKLLSLAEDQWYERKSVRLSPRKLAEALVAFANAEGGTVVVGLSNGVVEGLGAEQAKVNALRQAPWDFTAPPVRTSYDEVEVLTRSGESERVLVVRVEPGEAVHELTNGDCYLRVGDESRKLSYTQRQELHYDRGSAPYDGTAMADVKLDDLSAAQLDGYRQAISSSLSTTQMLHARSLLSARGGVTVAACLLFADHPQRFLPHAHVRVLRYREADAGTGSRQNLDADGDHRVEGSIPQMVHEAAAFIDDWTPKRRALTESGTFGSVPLIPRDAWLEGLVNAVVHRSYSAAGDHIRVEIFPDRLVIESPGRFPGLVDTTRLLDITRYARNPRIARVCADLSLTQELGEGIRRIVEEMRQAGLTDPVYRQTAGSVRLTLAAVSRLDPAVERRLPRQASEVLRLLRSSPVPLGTGEIVEQLGVARPTATKVLNALREEGQVVWSGKSAKDPRATWSLA